MKNESDSQALRPLDVEAMYKTLLGRIPESDSVVTDKVQSLGTVEQALLDFLSSQEFKRRYLPLTGAFWPEENIDFEVSTEELENLFKAIVRQWHYLGEIEPYWSVLSDKRFLRENYNANAEEFWASGELAIGIIFERLTRLGVPIKYGVCAELGCGTGRLTKPLISRFEKVIALDISASNLDVCRNDMTNTQLAKVELHLIRDPRELISLKGLDFFVSLITLQHNPPPIQEFMLETIMSKLNPGGVAVFQTPIRGLSYSFSLANYVPLVDNMEMHVMPISRLLFIINALELRCLDISLDTRSGPGFISATFTVQRPL